MASADATAEGADPLPSELQLIEGDAMGGETVRACAEKPTAAVGAQADRPDTGDPAMPGAWNIGAWTHIGHTLIPERVQAGRQAFS